LIIRKAKSPWGVAANRVDSDIVSGRQSYPLNFRQLKEKDARPNAPFADGYSTRYSEIITLFCNKMNKPTHEPPSEIDGARVIEWAWSGDQPFGEVPGADSPKIFGLAIAAYDDRAFYRFSCDEEWETQQDGLYASIDEAKRQLPDQYRNVEAQWMRR
jgi:hypothetical protein